MRPRVSWSGCLLPEHAGHPPVARTLRASVQRTHGLKLQALAVLASSVLSNLATVSVTLWLIRHLGSEAFGKAALVASVASSFASFTASGLALYLLRALSAAPRRDGACPEWSAAHLGGQLLAGAVSVAATCTLIVTVQDWSAVDLVLAAVILHSMTMDAVSKNALAGNQNVVTLAVVTAVGGLASAGLQASGGAMAGGRGYLAGLAIGCVVQALLSWAACRSRASGCIPSGVDLRQAWQCLRGQELLRFVVPASLSASLVPLAHASASGISAAKGSFSDVAVLTVAMQFFNMVMFLPTVINKIILPSTIRADAADAAGRRSRLRRQTLWLSTAFLAPLLVWLLQPLIREAYRFESPSSARVLILFAAAAAVACTLIPMANALVSGNRMWFGLTTNVVWATCYVGLAWFLPGAAMAVGVALLVAYIVNMGVLSFAARNQG